MPGTLFFFFCSENAFDLCRSSRSKCAQWHVLAMAASGKENVYDVVAMEFVGTFLNGSFRLVGSF